MSKSIEDKLRTYIDSYDGKPVTWGKDDCTAWAAGWAKFAFGIDISMPIYDSFESAHKLIEDAGGLAQLWIDQTFRFERVFEPGLGDIGIVDTRVYGQVGMVFAHGGVGYWRTDNGVRAFSPRHIMYAWRLRPQV